jgi:hypothetical protein
MTREEFESWVRDLSREGKLDDSRAERVIQQRRFFDTQRAELTEAFQQRVVGFVRGELLVADSVGEILERAQERGEDLLYFEPIGYAAFGESQR